MKTNVCYLGDCLDVLPTLPSNSVDSIVTDPPYHLASIVKRFGKEGSAPAKFGTDGAFKRASTGFMGKTWDGGDIAFNPEMWKECLRVLKPGGHLLSFSGTRTYHRMAVAIEDAGFEVRDMIEWVYGSGFPKSRNITLDMDKMEGHGNRGHRIAVANRHHPDGTLEPNGEILPAYIPKSDNAIKWNGWGTALKPAHEPICLARKPLQEKTVAENVLKYGTGGINIDESRVEIPEDDKANYDFNNNGLSRMNRPEGDKLGQFDGGWKIDKTKRETPQGRFPANLCHDNSEEVRECFPDNRPSSKCDAKDGFNDSGDVFKGELNTRRSQGYYDNGSTSRFFKSINNTCGWCGGDWLNNSCSQCGADIQKSFKSILYYPKASKSERNKGCEKLEKKENAGSYEFRTDGSLDGKPTDPKSNFHPTVKPIALMEYLIKMVTPKGGIVLEPFAGSGSTLVAAKDNGFQYIGIEMTEEYLPIIQARTGCEIIKECEEHEEVNCITCASKPSKELEIEATKELLQINKNICPECGGKIKGKYCEDCMWEKI